ncbi:hypothetical protein LWC35_32385 [Pseudonocardia kujensis]|nr:hypothetical protein [Pseudonocardia kujensis]MCE0767562.1 hypothetical protein [Pseudonocardia kujensis]
MTFGAATVGVAAAVRWAAGTAAACAVAIVVVGATTAAAPASLPRWFT